MFYLVGAGYLLNLTLRHGMVWYIFSMSIITINDIMAYMAGFFTGCTPLIVLSPKKTVEGFIGGGLATLVLGPLLAARLQEIATLTAAWEGVTPLGAEFYSGQLSPFVMHGFAISVFARYIYRHITEPESYINYFIRLLTALLDHLLVSSVPVSREPQIRKTLGALFLVTGESWTGRA